MNDPALFFPKALNIRLSGRSSDLSRFSEAFPFRRAEQWQVFQKTITPQNAGSGITAAGTVADSNRIPFSSQ
jgi:hypothetical protein